MTPDSPCNQVCQMDARGHHCLGCGRNAEEIAIWWRLTPDERRRRMVEIAARFQGARRASSPSSSGREGGRPESPADR
ncbi:MAG: DUF1289 domain-containing protein [Planctomycetota bacterium]